MYIYETRYQPLVGDMESSHFISDDIPRDLATAIRKMGNEVSLAEYDTSKRLIPWVNQVITVNQNWMLFMICEINADQNGCLQYISDCRAGILAHATPEKHSFDIDLSRTVTEVFSVTIDAADSETAQADAILMAEKDDMSAEWSIFCRDKAHVAEVYAVPDHTCKWCEEKVDINTCMVDGDYHIHDSCWDDYQEEQVET